MKGLTHVYIPIARRKEKEVFKDWCYCHVSSCSSEETWIYNYKLASSDKTPIMVFNFFEASDAIAFKLRFGI